MTVTDQLDVDDLFPGPGRGRAKTRRPRTRKVTIPWRPMMHLTLGAVACAGVWVGSHTCFPDLTGPVRAVAAAAAAALVMVVWVRLGPVVAAAATLAVAGLAFGAPALVRFAPALVSLVAIATLSVRAIRRRTDGAA